MNSSIEKKMDKPIDREKSCPLLLRVFLNDEHHHQPNDFSRGEVPANELQIYTWLDASLKELTNLVKEVNPESRKKGTVFDFAFIYPDVYSEQYKIRKVGSTCSGSTGPDDNLTLGSSKFQIGDFLDISIQQPSQQRDRMADRGGRRDHRMNRY